MIRKRKVKHRGNKLPPLVDPKIARRSRGAVEDAKPQPRRVPGTGGSDLRHACSAAVRSIIMATKKSTAFIDTQSTGWIPKVTRSSQAFACWNASPYFTGWAPSTSSRRKKRRARWFPENEADNIGDILCIALRQQA